MSDPIDYLRVVADSPVLGAMLLTVCAFVVAMYAISRIAKAGAEERKLKRSIEQRLTTLEKKLPTIEHHVRTDS